LHFYILVKVLNFGCVEINGIMEKLEAKAAEAAGIAVA